MRGVVASLIFILVLAAAAAGAPASVAPVQIVAAENFYGDVARQIGGGDVVVTSILSNPDQDPHLFEVSPSVGRAVSGADIVVYSGIDYDPWMQDLLAAARSTHRTSVDVAALAGRKAGDNPHVWYDVTTMQDYAVALAGLLETVDPDHAADYRRNLAAFVASLAPVRARIAALRGRLAGTPVTATEPIFGYMFASLGMLVRDTPFQLAVMNGTEPSARDIAGFESDLKNHAVKLLVYNAQASDSTADRMVGIAKASGVPVVGATETMPLGVAHYQDWMMRELDAVDRAVP